jgi:predicted amidohydrolase YtcJ
VSTALLHDVEVDGHRVDVLVAGTHVAAVEPVGSLRNADLVVDGEGGALIPGLHDHHVHLMAMAAARRSIDVSGDLDTALRAAHAEVAPGAWLRAVGYDDDAHGPLDRARLDALAPGRPVRVQHRSGALWVLSSAALEAVGADDQAGLESDGDGRLTGRAFRADGWLRTRVPIDDGVVDDLPAVGQRLASFGVTGVTDCTPSSSAADFEVLASAASSGALPFTVATTGGPALADVAPPRPLHVGPVKVVVEDHDLPPVEQLVDMYRRAHDNRRSVAVHCVTAAALALALAAWDETGAVDGDRVEHASIAPIEAVARLAERGVAVVTQPAFIASRGDAYLRTVDAVDVPDLYRCASLLAGGVEVGGSTDAPFGPDDPWVAIRAARDRTTADGAVVGAAEAVDARTALALFLAPLERPGGPPRRVAPHARADLCLLDRPLAAALEAPSRDAVVATFHAGEPTCGL